MWLGHAFGCGTGILAQAKTKRFPVQLIPYLCLMSRYLLSRAHLSKKMEAATPAKQSCIAVLSESLLRGEAPQTATVSQTGGALSQCPLLPFIVVFLSFLDQSKENQAKSKDYQGFPSLANSLNPWK